MPSLADTKTATSNEKKVDGVNLKGTSVNNTGNVSVTNKSKKNDNIKVVSVGENTDVDFKALGNGKYSITNNTGATINYTWL